MVLQSSGPISLEDIRNEFGGTAPDSITEYYRNGSFVPDTPANSGIPTSGQISLSDFYGGSAAPATSTYLVSLDLGRSPGVVPQFVGYSDQSRGGQFSSWTVLGSAVGGTDFIIGSNNRTIVAMGYFPENQDDFYVYLDGTGHTGEITGIDIEYQNGTISLGAADNESANDAGDTRYIWFNTGGFWTTTEANTGVVYDVTFTMT